MNKFMYLANVEAEKNIHTMEGGPFGAVIVRNGEVIASSHNQVLATNDPTMHAEIATIRKACKKLNTFDLSDCEIYSSCEPCPMCLSAIMWAKIKKIYFGCNREDAKKIGFDDNAMYLYLQGDKDAFKIDIDQIDSEECRKVFYEWANQPAKKMY